MANTKQARKRVRQNETRRRHNMSLRSNFRTLLKKFRTLVDGSNKNDNLVKAFSEICKKLDQFSTKGIIHKNKAARLKSRLNDQVKGLAS